MHDENMGPSDSKKWRTRLVRKESRGSLNDLNQKYKM